MKCQQCERPATFHITELEGGKHSELHLCEEHARQYLTQGEAEQGPASELAGALAQQMAVSQAAEGLKKLDSRACPVCGITFFDFRNQGRLGCPNDYVFFEKELEPLIANIHGETVHKGKHPKRGAGGTQQRTELIRMRRDMKEAIGQEDYERAKELRDEIKRVEEQQS
ncbi:MAG: UvrB/UvrC motif-containing protein [Pirellulales bacterium]|nr:UvrB/UvrC motif-containing protein [Pirellulales bacterium]